MHYFLVRVGLHGVMIPFFLLLSCSFYEVTVVAVDHDEFPNYSCLVILPRSHVANTL